MVGGAQATTRDFSESASLGLMQQKYFPQERNGASLKPVASAPSFALDIAVVVIDRMTKGGGMKAEKLAATSYQTQRNKNKISLAMGW